MTLRFVFFLQINIKTYDASITHVLRPNFDKFESCDCDSRLAEENTARLRAKWLKRFPGDAILFKKKNCKSQQSNIFFNQHLFKTLTIYERVSFWHLQTHM